MTLAQTQTAAQHLPNGPVGIGEHHSKPLAREVVLELLDMTPRPVDSLFVEVKEWGNKWVAGAVTCFQRGGTQAAVTNMLSAIPEQNGNPKPLPGLIASAICKGVSVYCADGPGQAVTPRNRFAWDLFRIKTTGGHTARCLLLFGGDHFDRDEPTLQTFLPGLFYLDCSM